MSDGGTAPGSFFLLWALVRVAAFLVSLIFLLINLFELTNLHEISVQVLAHQLVLYLQGEGVAEWHSVSVAAEYDHHVIEDCCGVPVACRWNLAFDGAADVHFC